MRNSIASFCLLLSILGHPVDAVTVYGPGGVENPTGTFGSGAPAATVSGSNFISAYNAYNNVTLTPPALPSPMPATSFSIVLPNQAANMPQLSIPHKGDFFGFSIEMSVVQQVSE